MRSRLKQRRQDLRLTQKELSKRAKVSRATISHLENRHTVCVRTDTLVKLADALDTRVSDLFF